MYQKSESIPLKGSAAILHNNLTILNHSKDKSVEYGIAGKNVFFLTRIDDSGVNPIFRQVVPQLIEKNANESQQLFNITEGRFIKISDRPVLAILTTKSVFFYDVDNLHLIHVHNLGIHGTSPDESSYSRGVAVINSNIVTIGTSSGIILLFEASNKASSLSQKNDINDRHFQSGISAMVSNPSEGILCAADTTRNLVVFSIKSSTNIKAENVIRFDNPATSLEIYRDFVICGLGNGTISICSINEGHKLVDIAAHGRWINSLNMKNNLLISTGEDCFFRVWELNEINGRLKVNHLQSERIIDNLICSAQFNKGTNEICVSSFDCNQLLIYRLG